MSNVFVADFETTTKEEDCRVWLWGLYNIYTDEFEYGLSIEDFFSKVSSLPNKSKIYIHNLKFDGEFCFYYLFNNGFTHSQNRKIKNNEFSTLITDMGVFYSIELRMNDKSFTLYDSLKIISLPLKKIPKAFGLTQMKGEIDYVKERPVGYIPNDVEVSYVQNDVEIVGKGLRYFFDQGLNRMTQSSNAFADYKKIMGKKRFEKLFPNLDEIDEEIRQSYKGGFTYANPKYLNTQIDEGIVLDVNGLYSFIMYNKKLPYGEPILYDGKYKEDSVYNLYIQMFRCNFEIKENHIPTIALKRSMRGLPTEYVTDSGGLDITMCLTSVDMELFFKHYNVYNIEYFNGWKFKSTDTLFKDYIDKWVGVKNQGTIEENEGMRTIAKFMLNMLYGRFGLNPNVRSKYPTFDGEFIRYARSEKGKRESVYLPVATFTTSYARQLTIEACQKEYHRFMYADTDSRHLKGLEIPENDDIDPVRLGAWKHEGNFNKAKILRTKSYIENMFIPFDEWDKLNDDKKKSWKWNFASGVFEQVHIACAGMPTYLHSKIQFDEFKDGLVVQGKLEHKRVKGGVILKEKDFTISL